MNCRTGKFVRNEHPAFNAGGAAQRRISDNFAVGETVNSSYGVAKILSIAPHGSVEVRPINGRRRITVSPTTISKKD